MNKHIITINSGSSSIKFAVFEVEGLSLLYDILVDELQVKPVLTVKDDKGNKVYEAELESTGHKFAVGELIKWIEGEASDINIAAVGHRIVHGGMDFFEPETIDGNIIAKLKDLIPLAPLHQPHNVSAIETFCELHPDIKQVACFDTAFHTTQHEIIKSYALPKKYYDEGIIRYGFHGLSYEYIVSTFDDNLKGVGDGKIIIAHLGNGSSMCAVDNKKSVATTMGFTALDGLMMGTRAGNIDPGIILYLMQEQNMELQQINDLLYKGSGLKGVSGISNNVRDLLTSEDERAKFAIDMFCLIAARNLAGLIPTLKGLDAIVFTAGIGENSALIREKICNHLNWLGIKIDNNLNEQNNILITKPESMVSVYAIPTNEELVIARHVKEVI